MSRHDSDDFPLEITHVAETTDITSDRPRKEVRMTDTETGKEFHVDFEYVRPTRGEGITLSEGDVEASDYWRVVGYGGAGVSTDRGKLARAAMIQVAVDHLRYHDEVTVKFTPGRMHPTPKQEEPEWVWFHSSGGTMMHLAAARADTSLCGHVDAAWPDPIPEDFDPNIPSVCNRCASAFKDATGMDDGEGWYEAKTAD